MVCKCALISYRDILPLFISIFYLSVICLILLNLIEYNYQLVFQLRKDWEVMVKKKSLEDLQKELAKKQEDIKIINRKIGQQKRYINTRIGEELLKGLEISISDFDSEDKIKKFVSLVISNSKNAVHQQFKNTTLENENKTFNE